MCDQCGSTDRVGRVIHRQMVADRPYIQDTCARCSKANALAYYRNGGAIIYARRAKDADAAPEPTTDETPRGGLDPGMTSREW